MKPLWELVNIKKHRPQNVKKTVCIACGTPINHQAHGLEHGGQSGMLIPNYSNTFMNHVRSPVI
jgi:hypothetical protein